MSSTFYEQISNVTNLFDTLSACEKTVVLCALIRRVPWSNLKLVKRTIDTSVVSFMTPEDQKFESEANDISILSKLSNMNDNQIEFGDRIQKLMNYLPLMDATNIQVKELYMNVIPELIQRCLDSCMYTYECQQILSYLLIHPAVTSQDRRELSQWLRFLENQLSSLSKSMWHQRVDTTCSAATPQQQHSNNNNNSNRGSWSSSSFRRTIGKNIDFKASTEMVDSLHDSFSKNGKDIDVSMDENYTLELIGQVKPRSNSLTPPTPAYMQLNGMSLSTENLSDVNYQKPRSFSLSSEHSLGCLKPINISLATGSETRLDDLRINNTGEHPGMSCVGHWLKSLRLHKYIWLFTNISYQRMITMDDEYLQKLGVTKGARHKLLLCIGKLEEREGILERMRSELTSTGATSCVTLTMLQQLRHIILSPLLPNSHLQQLIVCVLELASAKLLSQQSVETQQPTEEITELISLHCWLVERTLHSDAFTSHPALVERLKRLRHRFTPRQFFGHLTDFNYVKRTSNKTNNGRWRTNQTNLHQHKRASHPWIPQYNRNNQLTLDQNNSKSSSYPTFPTHESGPKEPLTTTQYGNCNSSLTMLDINTRLESLCLQMTEQAIN